MTKKDAPGWKSIPEGGLIVDAGNSREYHTGGWRTFKPVWIPDKCIHCMTCWICCPDASVRVEDGKMTGFDYDYCKGCGICESVCPVKDKAIKMVKEGEE